MRSSALLAVIALTGCRESIDYGPDISALQETVQTQQETIDALNTDLDAMDEQATADAARITALEEEIVAINGLDLTDLLGEVEDNTAGITALQDAGHATEQWVTDQGYATDSDLTAMGTTVTANTSQIGQNSTFIAANDSAITANAAAVNTNILSIASNTTDIGANAAAITVAEGNIGLNASNISTNTVDIATNEADIASNGGDIATNTGDIASNAADIAANLASIGTNAADIGTNATDIGTNATDIGTNTGDIAANAADIAATMDASLMGMYPAIFEYSSTAFEGSYEQGRAGHLTVTSGGAFRFSGQFTSAMSTNRRWFMTFYVTNPTSAPIDIDMEFCPGDSTQVYVDGIQTATNPVDSNGSTCPNLVDFMTLTPGDHEIRIRYIDGNNFLESLGVRNSWIIDNGLEIDWAGLNTALASGL